MGLFSGHNLYHQADQYQKAKDRAFKALGDTSPAGYLRTLNILQTSLRATMTGALDPAIHRAITDVLTRQGLAGTDLGKALASGALTIPGLEGLNIASAVTPELQSFQSAIAIAKSQVPRETSTASAIFSGAVEGAATGGIIGAVAGGVGGELANEQRNRTINLSKKAVTQAAQLASPENFMANMNAVLAASRAETDVQAQQAEITAQREIGQTGSRGTGVATQTEITAALAPEIMGIRRAASTAAGISKEQVGAKLGSTIQPPAPDPLTRALAVGAGLAAQYFTPEQRAARARQRAIDNPAGEIDPFFNPNGINQPVFSGRGSTP